MDSLLTECSSHAISLILCAYWHPVDMFSSTKPITRSNLLWTLLIRYMD